VTDRQTFPPNRIDAAMRQADLREAVQEDIEQILAMKNQRSVVIDNMRFISLITVIEFDLKRLEDKVAENDGGHSGSIEEVNDIFLEILEDMWGEKGFRLPD
jgi:hypothetical protein